MLNKSSLSVYVVSLRTPEKTPPVANGWSEGPRIQNHFAVTRTEAGAIALAQGECPGGRVVHVAQLGSEADLAAKEPVTLTIGEQTFTYPQPGLMTAAPPGTKLLREGMAK